MLLQEPSVVEEVEQQIELPGYAAFVLSQAQRPNFSKGALIDKSFLLKVPEP